MCVIVRAGHELRGRTASLRAGCRLERLSGLPVRALALESRQRGMRACGSSCAQAPGRRSRVCRGQIQCMRREGQSRGQSQRRPLSRRCVSRPRRARGRAGVRGGRAVAGCGVRARGAGHVRAGVALHAAQVRPRPDTPVLPLKLVVPGVGTLLSTESAPAALGTGKVVCAWHMLCIRLQCRQLGELEQAAFTAMHAHRK